MCITSAVSLSFGITARLTVAFLGLRSTLFRGDWWLLLLPLFAGSRAKRLVTAGCFRLNPGLWLFSQLCFNPGLWFLNNFVGLLFCTPVRFHYAFYLSILQGAGRLLFTHAHIRQLVYYILAFYVKFFSKLIYTFFYHRITSKFGRGWPPEDGHYKGLNYLKYNFRHVTATNDKSGYIPPPSKARTTARAKFLSVIATTER
jgi:hypothetical protein